MSTNCAIGMYSFRTRVRSRRALTLLEAMLASVVLAAGVVAVSQAVVAGQMQTYDALHRRRAMELGQALMEEILRLPYSDPEGATALGPDASETARTLYDNVDDYHGFVEAAGAVYDARGSSVSAALYPASHQVFSRSVTVGSGTHTVGAFGSAFSGLTVTVTVEDAGGGKWAIEQFVPQP